MMFRCWVVQPGARRIASQYPEESHHNPNGATLNRPGLSRLPKNEDNTSGISPGPISHSCPSLGIPDAHPPMPLSCPLKPLHWLSSTNVNFPSVCIGAGKPAHVCYIFPWSGVKVLQSMFTALLDRHKGFTMAKNWIGLCPAFDNILITFHCFKKLTRVPFFKVKLCTYLITNS